MTLRVVSCVEGVKVDKLLVVHGVSATLSWIVRVGGRVAGNLYMV